MMSVLSDRIREQRLAMGFTQTQLGQKVNKGESTVRMWELARSKPDSNTLAELSAIFGVTTDYLLGIGKKKQIERTELRFPEDMGPEILAIARASLSMTSHERERMLKLVETAFEDAFSEL